MTAKKSAIKKAKKRTEKKSAKSVKPKTEVQQALEVTWVLKGHLKNAQISYLRVGALLVRVRDAKLYAALGHPDVETYAEQRLHLGRTSLFKYLKVYDWVSRNHKEWLEPKPQGFIPDLSDAADLIRIETELEKKSLDKDTRAKLEAFRKQALAGELRQSDLAAWRKTRRQGADTVKAIVSALRRIRKRIARLEPGQPEALSQLDALIDVLGHARTLKLAGLDSVLPSKTPDSFRKHSA
jgi:hypothetical protein